eukprot:6202424-Pleurochrysis_carterae.AAC.1
MDICQKSGKCSQRPSSEASWMTKYRNFLGLQVNLDDSQYQIGNSYGYVAARAACSFNGAGDGWLQTKSSDDSGTHKSNRVKDNIQESAISFQQTQCCNRTFFLKTAKMLQLTTVWLRNSSTGTQMHASSWLDCTSLELALQMVVEKLRAACQIEAELQSASFMQSHKVFVIVNNDYSSGPGHH